MTSSSFTPASKMSGLRTLMRILQHDRFAWDRVTKLHGRINLSNNSNYDESPAGHSTARQADLFSTYDKLDWRDQFCTKECPNPIPCNTSFNRTFSSAPWQDDDKFIWQASWFRTAKNMYFLLMRRTTIYPGLLQSCSKDSNTGFIQRQIMAAKGAEEEARTW